MDRTRSKVSLEIGGVTCIFPWQEGLMTWFRTKTEMIVSSQLTHRHHFHLTSQSHHRLNHLGFSRGWWSPREPAAPHGRSSLALVRWPSGFSKTCFKQSIGCSHVIGQAPQLPGHPTREHVWFPSSLLHCWGEKRYKDHSHSQGMAHLRSAF